MRYNEFAIVEKKKRKKPRWAAYGPGPYGGYGYYAGYSGDGGGISVGGSDGGGVGEASYPGNIGAMEVFKFMNTASDFEKDLLKKLIAQKAYAKAWALVQGVTGTKLQGKEFGIEEGWRDTLAGLALGAGVALGSSAAEANVEKIEVSKGDTVYSIAKAFGTSPTVIQKLNKLDKNFNIKPGQTIKVPAGEVIDIIDEPSKEKKAEPEKKKQTKLDPSKTLTGTVHEAILTKAARAAGIKDPTELAAFLAQCAHESHDFKSMVEYGGSLDFRKYDPKFAPKKAKALGNKKVGDGARYKGRGYIQLTGRYNYKRAGEALGLPLEAKPELAEKPEVAAKIAVWFWKSRVQPNVDNFNDVRAVTKPINPGLNGLEDRKEAFLDFKKFKLAMR
jgi:predicted chitinase/molybdopterin-binding protein